MAARTMALGGMGRPGTMPWMVRGQRHAVRAARLPAVHGQFTDRAREAPYSSVVPDAQRIQNPRTSWADVVPRY